MIEGTESYLQVGATREQFSDAKELRMLCGAVGTFDRLHGNGGHPHELKSLVSIRGGRFALGDAQ